MHSSFIQNPGAWICVLSNLVLVMVVLNAILLWKLSRRANPATAARLGDKTRMLHRGRWRFSRPTPNTEAYRAAQTMPRSVSSSCCG